MVKHSESTKTLKLLIPYLPLTKIFKPIKLPIFIYSELHLKTIYLKEQLIMHLRNIIHFSPEWSFVKYKNISTGLII